MRESPRGSYFFRIPSSSLCASSSTTQASSKDLAMAIIDSFCSFRSEEGALGRLEGAPVGLPVRAQSLCLVSSLSKASKRLLSRRWRHEESGRPFRV